MAQKSIRDRKGLMFGILFIVAILTKDYFNEIEIPITIVALVVIGVAMLFDDQLIASAKMEAPKLICGEIASSIIPEYKVDLGNNFVAYGLGAYRTDFVGSSIGKEGVIIVHEPMIERNGFNINIQGKLVWVSSQNLTMERAKRIQKKFGYIPETIYRVIPNENSIKKIKEYSDVLEVKKAHDYVADIIAENDTLQKKNRFLEHTLGEMGHTVTNIIDKSKGYIKTASGSKIITPRDYTSNKNNNK